MHCVDCVARDARSAPRARTVGGAPVRDAAIGTRPFPVVTTTLIVVNVVIFGLTALAAGSIADNVASPWVDATWLVPADVAGGQWWRLLTSGFLHSGPLHVAANMFALWILGRDVEAVLGRLRFSAVYLISLVGASAAVMLFGAVGQPVLGASGAVFGLMGALGVLLRRLQLSLSPVITTIALNVVLSFLIPGLSLLAHLGGLAVGAVVTAGLLYGPARSRPAAGLAVAGAVLGVLVVLITVRAVLLY